MSKYAVIGFLGVLVFGSVFINCNIPSPSDPDTVKVFSISSIDKCIVDFYATGTGRVDVIWYCRYDSTGSHEITSKLVYVDGEGDYQAIVDELIPDGYVNICIYDTSQVLLSTTGETFYGNEPSIIPIITSLVANPNYAQAPVSVQVSVTVKEGGYPAFMRCDDGNGNTAIHPQVDRRIYTWGIAPYDTAGNYLIAIKIYNKWGSDVDTVGVTVTES